MNRNLIAIILAGLSIGLYFTYTSKLIDQINTTNSVSSGYVSALSSAKELIRLREEVRKDWNTVSSDDQARMQKMIPDTVDNIRLVIDLNSIAVKNGFSLKNIRASASSDGKKDSSVNSANNAGLSVPVLDTVTVSFNTTAQYGQFINFLSDLEKSLRIMDITHLTLSGSDTGTYDFGVELKTYWLRQ